MPLLYPANRYKIQGLLQTLENLVPQTHIPAEDLSSRKQTIAHFGLDVPRATLTLQHNGRRTEILLGGKTPPAPSPTSQLLYSLS